MISKLFRQTAINCLVRKRVFNCNSFLNPLKKSFVIKSLRTMSQMSCKTYRGIKVFKLSPNFEEATKIVDLHLNDPAPDEILVKNIYVGINATDLNITAGRYFAHDPVPYPLGIECLGEIIKTGSHMDKYKKGQFIVLKCAKMRAYSEYLYATSKDGITVIPEPKPEYLALLGTSGLTAAIGLSESARMARGETVLVTAAAGGLGHIAAQWAKINGCHVIALTSNKKKEHFLKQIGCDRIINYKEEDLDKILKKEYPNGVDIVWETIGSPLFEQLFEHLARKGRLINVGATAGYKTIGYKPINIDDFIVKLHYGARTVIGFLVFDYKEKYPEYNEKLLELFHKNQIKIKVDFGEEVGQGLEAVAKALKYLHSGSNLGKVVVKL